MPPVFDAECVTTNRAVDVNALTRNTTIAVQLRVAGERFAPRSIRFPDPEQYDATPAPFTALPTVPILMTREIGAT